MTITEFLLARIAEDEEAWSGGIDLATRPDFAKMSRHMLAECEAKRRIVESCRPRYAIFYRESEYLLASAFDQETMKVESASGPIWPNDLAENVLRALALPYVDHPDYDEAWRP